MGETVAIAKATVMVEIGTLAIKGIAVIRITRANQVVTAILATMAAMGIPAITVNRVIPVIIRAAKAIRGKVIVTVSNGRTVVNTPKTTTVVKIMAGQIM
ncbi:hypothetical protein TUM12370_23030 [Salmonella enterica subsp. enterica serovar Choleraesuis]|nr:hypothetical protein TUM12370_23030 [Salmonella enterica subsp. enterica serovar Choleraesuis]